MIRNYAVMQVNRKMSMTRVCFPDYLLSSSTSWLTVWLISVYSHPPEQHVHTERIYCPWHWQGVQVAGLRSVNSVK